MAFQDFDAVSERRKNEKKQKMKRNIIIAICVTILVLVAIGGGVAAFLLLRKKDHGGYHNNNNNNNSPPAKEINQSQKAIQSICSPTDYKNACESSLKNAVKEGTNSSRPTPTQLLKYAIEVSSDELAKAINQSSSLFEFATPEEKGAFEDCKVLLEDAMEELNATVSDIDLHGITMLPKITPDLNNWLSAVLTYQQICIDGFPEGKLKTSVENVLKNTNQLTSNGLAIIKELASISSTFQLPTAKSMTARHLLTSKNGLPSWMSKTDKHRVLAEDKEEKKPTPNVTVAKDGSGNFNTINEALAALPPKYEGRYVIFIKEGIYDEHVVVTKKMENITMYGEGSQKTIVTGNKNFVDGVRTFQTASFVALGAGFMAQSMGFRNTAGPEKHQAVALRVQSDRSIFLNCRMEGYQDTLYAQTHRQFYRSCYITGTVDFIFGDAAAVFQNCAIYVRRPMEHQQNIVTAQGRIYKHQTTGFVLQNCRILADETLKPIKTLFRSYLGRPWKEYSRTIVMESDISDFIHPDGWMEWNGDFALKTLYYAEFNNKGPGADLSARVKWPGYHVINKEEAMNYTLGQFLEGESWLTNGVDVPARFGFSKN